METSCGCSSRSGGKIRRGGPPCPPPRYSPSRIRDKRSEVALLAPSLPRPSAYRRGVDPNRVGEDLRVLPVDRRARRTGRTRRSSPTKRRADSSATRSNLQNARAAGDGRLDVCRHRQTGTRLVGITHLGTCFRNTPQPFVQPAPITPKVLGDNAVPDFSPHPQPLSRGRERGARQPMPSLLGRPSS